MMRIEEVRAAVFRVATAMLLTLITLPAAAQQPYDLLLRGARVLDGTGNPWYYADIAVSGDRIQAVGNLTDAQARTTIDAAGLFIAPGFIDVHSHAGGSLDDPELSAAAALLMQGITTAFINPDGGGAVDLVEQRNAITAARPGVNVALLVPHGSVRGNVLGMADRAPDANELERMRGLVRAGMETGAFGMSSGPFYAPGSYARTDELIALARIASEYGGAYTSHIRDESDYTIGLVAAVDEVIEVAREADLPGVVTHIKALGPRVWGYSAALVHRIDRAREQGIEVYADQYPYEASSTSLSAALLPRWAQVGGRDSLRMRLDDAATRARIRVDALDNLDRRGGAERIMIGRYSDDPTMEGRTLGEIANERGVHPIDLALDLVRSGGPGIISFNMHEFDIRTLMQQPWTMTASDGALPRMGVGLPHPRAYGTFPRRLRRYSIDDTVVDMAMAIRSMTSLPATVFRMKDRGVLRTGAVADIVVFDAARITDRATFQEPHQLAEGMVHVLIGGRFAVRDGMLTNERLGQVLDRRAQ